MTNVLNIKKFTKKSIIMLTDVKNYDKIIIVIK